MLINWFTVAAQALNFLILVGLLKHFLYKPILTAIEGREKHIAGELADAAAKLNEARNERDDFQRKNQELEQERAALLSRATGEAKAERERLIAEAQREADALGAKYEKALQDDARNHNQAIARRAQQEVFAVVRKALTDLATTSLEERMGAVFTRRLRTLDSRAKAELAEALRSASAPALVQSAFELPGEQRAVIQNALNETFSTEVQLRFEVAPNLVSGIELTANGKRLGWSIAGYLASLEKAVDQLVKERHTLEPKPLAKPQAEAKPEPEASTKPQPKPEAEPEPQAKPDAPRPEANAHEQNA